MHANRRYKIETDTCRLVFGCVHQTFFVQKEWNTKYHSLFTFQFSCCYRIFSYRSNQRMNMYDVRITYIIFFLQVFELRKTFLSYVKYIEIEKRNSIWKIWIQYLYSYWINFNIGNLHMRFESEPDRLLLFSDIHLRSHLKWTFSLYFAPCGILIHIALEFHNFERFARKIYRNSDCHRWATIPSHISMMLMIIHI